MRLSLLPLAAALALGTSLTACADAGDGAAPAVAAAASGQLAPAAAAAGEAPAPVRAALEGLFPGLAPDLVRPAPFPGFQEVVIGGGVFYVSDDGRQLIQGRLFDVASRTELSAAPLAQVATGILAGIPASERIVFAPPNPRFTVTVFTDIDCGYCRRMHLQIAEYNALGIAVEYLFYPRAGLGSEAHQQAVAVWCSADRRDALTRAKAGVVLPAATCDNPIAHTYEVGRRVGLQGTPAVFGPDGRQLGGYLEPAALLRALEGAAAP